MNDSNSLLEYFISAKTCSNKNSTRATKLLKLSIENNRLTGFKYIHYFLEKNRIVYHDESETIFHFFVMAGKGMTDEEKDKYMLSRNFHDYFILDSSLKADKRFTKMKRYEEFKLMLDVSKI